MLSDIKTFKYIDIDISNNIRLFVKGEFFFSYIQY